MHANLAVVTCVLQVHSRGVGGEGGLKACTSDLSSDTAPVDHLETPGPPPNVNACRGPVEKRPWLWRIHTGLDLMAVATTRRTWDWATRPDDDFFLTPFGLDEDSNTEYRSKLHNRE